MKRRRVFIGMVVLGAILAAALALSRPTPLEERVGRIRAGMSGAEVDAVLGAPPGDHTRYVTYVRHGGIRRADSPIMEWDYDEGCVDVRFGPDGRVEDVTYYPNSDPPSVWDRVRHHLPW